MPFNIPIPSGRPLALPLDTSPVSNALLALQQGYWKAAEQQAADEKLNMALRHEQQQNELFPFTKREAKTRAETGELNLENTKGFRDDVAALTGARAPNNPSSMRPVGAGPAPGATPPQPSAGANDPWADGGAGRRLASSTAALFKQHILDEPDAAKAQQRYDQFRADPTLAPFISGAGYSGGANWRDEAQHIFDDAQARASGQTPPPRYGTPPPATGAPASGPQNGPNGGPNGGPGSQASPVYAPNAQAVAQLPFGTWFITNGPDGRPTAPQPKAPSAQLAAGMPPAAPGAPQAAAVPTLAPAPPAAPAPAPQQAQAQAQTQSAAQKALEEIHLNESILNLAMRRGQPVPKAIEDRMAELRKSGQWFLSGQGFVDVPGYGENLAERKAKETSATKQSEYYDHLHTGLAGSAQIAAQQKQNIAIIRTLMDQADGIFSGYGTAPGLQQGFRRGLATLGIAPEAAANREVFNQTMARILADQFSGLKSMSSMTGETAPRVFQSMLHVEEKAIATADDSTEGIRRKTDILDHAGDLMMRWGDLADAHIAKHGRLDPNFDSALRAEIAKARIPGYEGAGPNTPAATPAAPGTPGTPQQQAQGQTKPQQASAPIGASADAAVGSERTVGNDTYVKTPAGWAKKAAAAPAMTPEQMRARQALSPADRLANDRATATVRADEARTNAAAQTKQLQDAFDADLRSMPPLAVAQKYGRYSGIINQLRPDQQTAINAALSGAVPMMPRR